MKKLILVASLIPLLTSLDVNARALICPFTDYFTISAPVGYAIASLSSDGNIVANIQDPTHFTTGCKSYTSTESGNAYMTVAVDAYSLCTLHIVDGPYEMNPYVNFVNCVGGLKYSGMDHDWGTYNYKLKFTHN